MGLIAYELREDYRGTVTQNIDGEDVEVPVFTGGLVHVGTDGREADVRELVDGRDDGVIVVDDYEPVLVVALDAYPALKRTKVPDGAIAVNVAAKYEELSKAELRAEATARGIAGGSSASKAELVAALEEHDRRLAEGGLEDLGTPLTVTALAAAAAPDTDTEAPTTGVESTAGEVAGASAS